MKSRVFRIVRFLAVSFAALLALLFAAYAAIYRWGQQELKQSQAELLALGEPMSLAELVPKPIPDEQNFFATKSWKQLVGMKYVFKSEQLQLENSQLINPFDVFTLRNTKGEPTSLFVGKYSTRHFEAKENLRDLDGTAQAYRENNIVPLDSNGTSASIVLRGMEHAAPLLTEIEEGATRPDARFPEEADYSQSSHLIFYVNAVMKTSQVLGIRAVARMAADDSSGAAQDILLICYLAQASKASPLLIAKLVQMSCLQIANTTFWDCNARGTWNEPDLTKIQQAFADCHPIKDLIDGFRFERVISNDWFSKHPSQWDLFRVFHAAGAEIGPMQAAILLSYPRGFHLEGRAFANLFLQQEIDAIRKNDTSELSRLQENPVSSAHFWQRSYFNLFSQEKDFAASAIKALDVQSQLNLAQIACALERYHLQHGSFPPSLDALLPDFISTIPLDPVTRQPIAYQLIASDNYQLICNALKPSSFKYPPDGKWTWNRLPPSAHLAEDAASRHPQSSSVR